MMQLCVQLRVRSCKRSGCCRIVRLKLCTGVTAQASPCGSGVQHGMQMIKCDVSAVVVQRHSLRGLPLSVHVVGQQHHRWIPLYAKLLALLHLLLVCGFGLCAVQVCGETGSVSSFKVISQCNECIVVGRVAGLQVVGVLYRFAHLSRSFRALCLCGKHGAAGRPRRAPRCTLLSRSRG